MRSSGFLSFFLRSAGEQNIRSAVRSQRYEFDIDWQFGFSRVMQSHPWDRVAPLKPCYRSGASTVKESFIILEALCGAAFHPAYWQRHVRVWEQGELGVTRLPSGSDYRLIVSFRIADNGS